MSLLVVHIPLSPVTHFMVFIFVSLGPALFQYMLAYWKTKQGRWLYDKNVCHMLALLLLLPSFHPPRGNDFVSQLHSPIIQCFMFVWIQFWFTFLKSYVLWMFYILLALVCIPGSISLLSHPIVNWLQSLDYIITACFLYTAVNMQCCYEDRLY